MSIKRCCVPKCTEKEGQVKVLHLFPNPEKDIKRFRRWVHVIGGDILVLSDEKIFKHRRICNAHFEEKYCCRNNRISNTAVPTLHMPGSFLPKLTKPLREIQNIPSTSKDNLVAVKQDIFLRNIKNPDCSLTDTLGSVSLSKFTYSRKSARQIQNLPLNSEGNVVAVELEPPTENTEKIACTVIGNSDTSTKPKKRKQIRLSKMSINEKEIYEKLVTIRTQLIKFRSKVKKLSSELKFARNFMTNPKFQKIMNSLPSSAKMVTLLQFREYKKKEKGRRFSVKEKILALALLKQSPKAYKFLRKIFILPSPQVLTKLLQKADVQPGINDSIFCQLKERANKMKMQEKLCILLFDEMSLKAHKAYNERRDCVIGFVSNGEKTTTEIADHAQVFMIRGLVYNYKLPVAYTFSQAATKGHELAAQIKTVIRNLLEAGLEVCATVCDQGSNNRHAIRLLCEETRMDILRRNEEVYHSENIIIINGNKIFPIYDPPHLLKGIRNNLLTKNLKYVADNQEKIAKWQHILLLHSENNIYKGIKLITKLTDCHVISEKIPKMKVKYASQVFSRSLAAHMGLYAEKGLFPQECQETAEILLFFDNLFDSLNGSFSKKRLGKPLQGPVKPGSPHENKWTESIKILKTMKFESNNYVPTIDGWVWTLEGVKKLIIHLRQNYDVSSVWMRHLNQDQLESFFGSIRNHGWRNTNPTPEKFESAFTSLLVNKLTSVHSPGMNCEKDQSEALFALILAKDGKAANTRIKTTSVQQIDNIILTSLEDKNKPHIMGPLQYISGYFLKKNKI